MEQASGELLIITTLDDAEKAARFARGLVETRLAACVSLVDRIRSFYRWESEDIRDESEYLLLIKTHRAKLPDIERYFQEAHPYECPELMVIAVSDLSLRYRDWLHQELCLPSISPSN